MAKNLSLPLHPSQKEIETKEDYSKSYGVNKSSITT